MDDEAVLPADGLYVVSGWVVCYTTYRTGNAGGKIRTVFILQKN